MKIYRIHRSYSKTDYTCKSLYTHYLCKKEEKDINPEYLAEIYDLLEKCKICNVFEEKKDEDE